MYSPNREIEIQGKKIGNNNPTYFIADIAANHDGDLERAKDLIYMCAEAGAVAAKFQHFTAETIVSDYGFRSLGAQESHQAAWKKSVYEIYDDASLALTWTPILKETCDKAGIAFFTSPYSFNLVDEVDPYVSAYKIGSGDITFTEIIEYMSAKNKPVILATGASSMDDINRAVSVVLRINSKLILMQCNTNYTASVENFKYIQLNVLRTWREMYPSMIFGLSDHTPGHTTVLGAIALGARIVEKHFTDDNDREGPDHRFSLNPQSWREMVDRSRELELSLGDGVKKIEDNEKKTVILQRRAIRVTKKLVAGTVLQKDFLTVLRPSPVCGIPPYRMCDVVGKTLTRSIKSGEHIKWTDLN